MKTLRIIQDTDIPSDQSLFKTREASRAIIFDEQGLTPLLYVSKYKFHKIPGGGIKKDETKEDALHRELFEEAGCKVKITTEIGNIIEYRSAFKLKQISYCYLGSILSKGIPSLTEEEISGGFKLEWQTLDEAISKIKNDTPIDYEGSFIKERDLLFLVTAKKLLKQ